MPKFKHLRSNVSATAIALAGLAAVSVGTANAQPATLAGEDPATRQAILDKMDMLSVDQKLNLLTGQGFSMTNERIEATDRFVPGAAGYTYAVGEHDIPSLVLADGPAGLRLAETHPETGEPIVATAFPIATLIASSWDVKLAESIGKATGAEAEAYGVDIILAPGMNLHRNPLTGRNFEYYSEDPILSGMMAGAAVRGMQSEGIGGTIKHYVANNQETNRFVVDTLVDQRALRELYLKGFEIAIEEGEPWAVMTAYNRLNGEYASQNRALLVDILREDLGFDGVIMTDWFSGDNPPAQIMAGNNLIMPGSPQHDEQLKAAWEAGELSEDVIDENVYWIMKTIDRAQSADKLAPDNNPPLEANATLARRAGAEATVLLKNEGDVLPLGEGVDNVALFGVGSYSTVSGGTGSGDVSEAYIINVADGLEEHGWTIDGDLQARYQEIITEFEANQEEPQSVIEQFLVSAMPPEMEMDKDLLAASVEANAAAIITISRNSGEFADRQVEGDFDLTAGELEMLEDVSEAFRASGKPVIVVLNIGNVIEMASWRDLADAIVLPWQGGQEAGRAIADVLSGEVNPSGRLPMTFPLTYEDTPSAKFFPGTEDRSKPVQILGGMMTQYESEVAYEEGIFVGYRYFTSADQAVAYPFGYGLSYTSFAANDLEVTHRADDEAFGVELDVSNTGDVAGRQVVQVYVEAPEGKLEKPRRELKAFAKTGELAPGEAERVTLSFSYSDLASFDAEASEWIIEPGDYTVQIGASANDILLEETISLPEEIIVETVSQTLAPPRQIGQLFQQ